MSTPALGSLLGGASLAHNLRLSIHMISDPAELLAPQHVWNKLVNDHSRTPFLSGGFVKLFAEECASSGWNPMLLIVSANGTPVGMTALASRRMFGIRLVRFPCDPYFLPDFVIDDNYRDKFVGCILGFLFENLQCHFAHLVLPFDSPTVAFLRSNCRRRRIHLCTRKGHFWAHRVLFVSGSWDEFESSRGSNFRRHFRRIAHHLDATGSWKVLLLDKQEEAEHALDRILDVESRSWKGIRRARSAMETDESLSLIWRGLLSTATTQSGFNWGVWFLDLEEKPIAYALVMKYKETAFIAKTSFDERYRKFYPGIYIVNAAIRDFFRQGQVRSIDFLTNLPFEARWKPSCVSRTELLMCRKGIASRILTSVLMSAFMGKVLAGVLRASRNLSPIFVSDDQAR